MNKRILQQLQQITEDHYYFCCGAAEHGFDNLKALCRCMAGRMVKCFDLSAGKTIVVDFYTENRTEGDKGVFIGKVRFMKNNQNEIALDFDYSHTSLLSSWYK